MRSMRLGMLQGTADPVVEGQGEEPPDLVGEHESLSVLREGDEAYRPHALPPSRRVGLRLPRLGHPGAFRNTVRARVTRWG